MGRMADRNNGNTKKDLEEFHCEDNTQDASNDADNINRAEHESEDASYDGLLQKLDKMLADPLHRRLLRAYVSTDISSAKEAMEHELARILLEVIDRVD